MEPIEKKKSIKVNMLLNSIKSLMSVLFPLITFPYIARILGVENVGKYNFANSIISYFVLLAGLGINTYGIRNGSEIRNNTEQLNYFVNQIFSINIFSTGISYLLLGISLLVVNKFHEYTWLLIILSCQIAFTTIGIEWLYSIYEDYFYITMRSIAFQLVSLILMFAFVRSPEDVNIYACFTVFSSVGSNLMNLIHAKKYVKIRIINDLQLKRHLKPIFVFFATAITVVIYVNSDTTILGFLSTDASIGIYSVSVNVYKALKTILSAIITVSIPRMAMLWGNNRYEDFANLGKDIYHIFLTFVFPAIVGVIVLRKDIIYLLAGNGYESAQDSLVILSVSLLFCLGAGFWSQGVLIPQGKEFKVFKITVVSAILNILLNFVLIPVLDEKAAALTTLLAEALVFFYCRKIGRSTVSRQGTIILFLKILLGCFPMYFISSVGSILFNSWITRMLFVISVCISEYLLIEIILKNEILISYLNEIRKKFKKK